MEIQNTVNKFNGQNFDLDQLIADAEAQRDQLLLKFPKLKALQEDINTRISDRNSLFDRFSGMVSASESFRSY